MSTFNERFKQLKKEFNLSNNKLAKIINVSFVTIKRWKNGLSKPKITKFYELCIFFNVSCDYLLGLSNMRKYIKRVSK